jgi:hypothetical protein
MPKTWPKSDNERWGKYWSIAVYVHYNVGPDEAAYLCLNKMKGERCPICEARLATRDQDERQALALSEVHLAWVIDRNNEKIGPQVWRVPSKKIRNEVANRAKDRKTGQVLDVDREDEGYDISFIREGEGLKTNYTAVEIDRDPSPLHDDPKVMDKWLDDIMANPLPTVLNYYEADYIEKVLGGQVSREDKEEEAEQEAPRPRRFRAATEEETQPVRPERGMSVGLNKRQVDDEEEAPWEEETKPARRPARDDGGDSDPSTTGRAALQRLRERRGA